MRWRGFMGSGSNQTSSFSRDDKYSERVLTQVRKDESVGGFSTSFLPEVLVISKPQQLHAYRTGRRPVQVGTGEVGVNPPKVSGSPCLPISSVLNHLVRSLSPPIRRRWSLSSTVHTAWSIDKRRVLKSTRKVWKCWITSF